MSGSVPQTATRRPLPAMLIAGVVGLVLGYAALLVVNAGIGLIWDDIPASWETTPAWYVTGVLLVAAVLGGFAQGLLLLRREEAPGVVVEPRLPGVERGMRQHGVIVVRDRIGGIGGSSSGRIV